LHPLVQGVADAAALVSVFDHYEAQEAASGGEAGAHWIDAGEHAVESECHVVVFGELKDGQHVADDINRVGSVSNSRSSESGRHWGSDCATTKVVPFPIGHGRVSIAGAEVHNFFGQGKDAGLAGNY
jgi:hypothetical protein